MRAAPGLILAVLCACSVEQPKPRCLAKRGGWAARYTPLPGQTLPGACASKPPEILGVQTFFGAGPSPTQLALRPELLTDAGTLSVGRFEGEFPDDEGFCVADGFSVSELDGYRYEFAGVKVVATADIQGQQLSARLRYDDPTCTAEYDVAAVYPAVDCGVFDADFVDYLRDADGGVVTDAALCGEYNFFGRALSARFPVVCEPVSHLCVLDGEVPALR